MSFYTDKAISGVPYAVDEANPTQVLGTLAVATDGRKFRYVKAGASALVAGELLQSPAEVTGDQSLAIAAAAIGDLTVTTTGTVTVTANQYAGGLLITTGEGGTGNGIAYRIKSHPAATAAVVVITLEDPIQVALTTATQIDLVANPYNGVIQNPTTASGTVVGVAVNNITASQYGWIQTGGVAAVLSQGGATVGVLQVASNGTAGAVENAANASTEAQAIVGIAATGVATTEYGAVKLLID